MKKVDISSEAVERLANEIGTLAGSAHNRKLTADTLRAQSARITELEEDIEGLHQDLAGASL